MLEITTFAGCFRKVLKMRKVQSLWMAVLILSLLVSCVEKECSDCRLFPASNAVEVNPDTHLVMTFLSKPKIGNKGKIRVYELATHRLVDSLDLSIPAGPTIPDNNIGADYTKIPYNYTPTGATNANTKPGTPSGTAVATPDSFQLTIIGGFTDAFHFYPIIVHENTATIYLHHQLLEYDKQYYVTMDEGVLSLSDNSFHGIQSDKTWRFTTKSKAPSKDSKYLMVSADGSADFNTVQGALDFVPDAPKERVTIFIKNGDYEEIVYFRNKSNLHIVGESRDSVVVHYKNNEVFNPHPKGLKTNEVPGTFPSRRAAFMGDNIKDVQISNMTLMTTARGQAEGLLLMGERIVLYRVHVVGDGDALQANGSVYLSECLIDGGGDTVLGRGTLFFQNCTLRNNGGPFMWIRNTQGHHGNIFVDCLFKSTSKKGSDLARCPINHGKGYPYSEAVLINCQLDNITAQAWSTIGGDTKNIHYWEYNSTYPDGRPVETNLRHPASKRLHKQKDAALIANYSRPDFIFDGWHPEVIR